MKKLMILLLLWSVGGHANILDRYEKACDAKDYEACISLGFAYTKNSYKGVEVKKDYHKSIAYFNFYTFITIFSIGKP